MTPGRAAVLIFLLASTAMTLWGRGERSAWILMTSPTGSDHWQNTLLGYCYLHGGEPFMKENIPHAAQVGVYCGSFDALSMSEFREDFRLLRGAYSFLASLPAPLVGVIPAMLAVNWLCWLVCAWMAWRLTLDLFEDRWAALLSVTLVSGGMGMIVHLGDYSPHLLAFATYYAGVWLLYRSRVYRESRPWSTHLRLGTFLALACLAYNTGVMLVGVYVLTALRRNRLPHLAAAAALALSARPLWQLVLGPRVVDLEADYLRQSLAIWAGHIQTEPLQVVKTLARWISEYVLFFDSPLVVIAGLGCVWAARLPAEVRRFGLAAITVPLLAALVFTPKAMARGYLVYGASIWVYVCLAGTVSAWLKGRSGRLRVFGGAMVIVLLATSHYAWSTAHLGGWLGPVKTYFLGWDEGSRYLFSAPTKVLSLTGEEPTPIAWGGGASLVEAGSHVTPEQHVLGDEQVSFWVALAARGWFFGYLGLLALVAAGGARQRVVLLTAVAAVYLGGCALAAAMFRSSPAFFPVDRAVPLAGGQTLRYELALSREVVSSLRRHVGESDWLALYFPGGHFHDPRQDVPVTVSFRAGGVPLPVVHEQPGLFALRGAALGPALERLARAPLLSVEVSNATGSATRLVGWQRNSLRLRDCRYVSDDADHRDAPERPGVLPALEFRVMGSNGRIRFAGF